MAENAWLAEEFEAARGRLRAMAFRMLGSAAEAEDAVQEAWLRLARSDGERVANLGGWLTTVVTRICLDMLRARSRRREDPIGPATPEPAAPGSPEDRMALADSVGIALLVVLDRLAPAERIAFVLHDMFDLPFDAIAAILSRSPAAARQLASRARRRIRGPAPNAAPADHRRAVAEAFLAASRAGDLAGLVALLDPDAVLRGDAAAQRLGGQAEIRGAEPIARFFSGRAGGARPMLAGGEPALVVAPAGRLLLVLRLSFHDGRIAAIDAVAEPARLAALELTLPGD